MLVYLILFIGFALFYFSQKETPHIGFYLFFGFAILVAGFRDMIGGYDVYIYGQIFEYDIYYFLKTEYFEPLFLYYYLGLKLVDDSREWMFFASSVLVLGGQFFSIKKVSPYIFVSMFIYFAKFYLMSFVYVRQGVAMLLVWIAFALLKDKRYLWSVLLIVGSAFLHRSAIIALPFVFIAYRVLKNWQIALVFLGGALFSFTPLDSFFFESVADTIQDERVTTYAEKTSSVNLFYFIEGILVFFLVAKFKKYQDDNPLFNMVLNGFFIYGVVIFFSLTNATFIRLAWYYFYFVVVGLPFLIKFAPTNRVKKLLKAGILIYYTAVFFRLLIVYDGGDFMPYKSIFQDFDRHGRWEFMEYRRE